jgi:ketosteroid isomerase-like protein
LDPDYGRLGQMSFNPVVALVAYHAALDAHDLDVVEALMAEDATYESAGIGVVIGRDAIISAMRKYFAAHTDHKASDDFVEETSPVSASAVWQLTATSNATGEKFLRRGEETVTFDSAGKVSRVVVIDK